MTNHESIAKLDRQHNRMIVGLSAVVVAGAVAFSAAVMANTDQAATANPAPKVEATAVQVEADTLPAGVQYDDASGRYAVQHEGATLTLLPCEFEDSANCIWIASEAGNGEGVSFYDVAGEVFYLD